MFSSLVIGLPLNTYNTIGLDHGRGNDLLLVNHEYIRKVKWRGRINKWLVAFASRQRNWQGNIVKSNGLLYAVTIDYGVDKRNCN